MSRVKPQRITRDAIDRGVSKIDTAIADGAINESFSHNGVTIRRTTETHLSGHNGYTVENRVSKERFALDDRAKVLETAVSLMNIPAMTTRELENELKRRQAQAAK